MRDVTRIGVAGAVLTMLVGLGVGSPRAETSGRRECLAACAERVAACGTVCSEFGDLGGACRRAVLRRCRLEGTSTCAGSTSTTTTSTTMPPTGESCADILPLAVSPTLDGSIVGDTSGAADDLSGSCVVQPGARDRVYSITNPRNTEVAFLSAAVLPVGFDAAISIRSSCAQPQTELTCANSGGAGATEIANAPMPPSSTFYLVVDGASADQAGSFTLTFSFE